jgi:hypothetical protein
MKKSDRLGLGSSGHSQSSFEGVNILELTYGEKLKFERLLNMDSGY